MLKPTLYKGDLSSVRSEHSAHNQAVAGSIPAGPIKKLWRWFRYNPRIWATIDGKDIVGTCVTCDQPVTGVWTMNVELTAIFDFEYTDDGGRVTLNCRRLNRCMRGDKA